MIHIIVLNEDHLDKSGIYRIWFGHKYYIGSTSNSTQRSFLHECAINERILYGIRGDSSPARIANHFDANPHLSFGFFEMIKLCEGERFLVYWEQRYLNGCRGDCNCLNKAFSVSRYFNGITYTGKEVVEEEINSVKSYIAKWKDAPYRYVDEKTWLRALEIASYEWTDHKEMVSQALE